MSKKDLEQKFEKHAKTKFAKYQEKMTIYKIFKKLIAVNSRQIQLAMGGSSADAMPLGEVGISMLFGGRCC